MFGKFFKGVGKKIVGAFIKKAPKLKEVGKRIGEKIVVDLILSEGVGEIVEAIGGSILGDNNPPMTPEDSDYGNEVSVAYATLNILFSLLTLYLNHILHYNILFLFT